MTTTTTTTTTRKIEALKAYRALRALLADPDDLPQVFALLEAFSTSSIERIERRLGESAAGRVLLAARPDVVKVLEDREALQRLPEGSLGRAYLAFVESENISAAGIRAAAATGMKHEEELPENLAFVHARMRDTHDLWHALTGYKGDVLGEAALLGFTLAQAWNPGIAMLVVVGIYKTIGKPEATRLIVGGFRRGLRAAWLPELPWESMLAEPVAAVRARLGVGAPPVYTPVRSWEIKAAAAAA